MTTEYVYLARRADGLHKIGCTGNLAKRINGLMKEHDEFELIHSIETNNARMLESELHRQFAEQRREGEWFDLLSWDIESLTSIHSRTFPINGSLVSSKSPCVFNLSSDAQDLLEKLSTRNGISKTAVLELAIRNFAERDDRVRKTVIENALRSFIKELGVTVTDA